mmetsp:Transcript_132798/g.424891  ORF Transcript_132798/g.424891 Transcript_132798/m.424891 type:complete len:353 (-) Transcript_132798:968-2026(-)
MYYVACCCRDTPISGYTPMSGYTPTLVHRGAVTRRTGCIVARGALRPTEVLCASSDPLPLPPGSLQRGQHGSRLVVLRFDLQATLQNSDRFLRSATHGQRGTEVKQRVVVAFPAVHGTLQCGAHQLNCLSTLLRGRLFQHRGEKVAEHDADLLRAQSPSVLHLLQTALDGPRPGAELLEVPKLCGDLQQLHPDLVAFRLHLVCRTQDFHLGCRIGQQSNLLEVKVHCLREVHDVRLDLGQRSGNVVTAALSTETQGNADVHCGVVPPSWHEHDLAWPLQALLQFGQAAGGGGQPQSAVRRQPRPSGLPVSSLRHVIRQLAGRQCQPIFSAVHQPEESCLVVMEGKPSAGGAH